MTQDGPRKRTLDRVQQLAAAAAVAGSVACKGGAGYGVVDMLPTPAQCPDPGLVLSIAARADLLALGTVKISLILPPPLTQAGVQVISGATLLHSEVTREGVFTIELQPDAADAGVPAPIRLSLEIHDCDGTQLFDATIDPSALPTNFKFTPGVRPRKTVGDEQTPLDTDARGTARARARAGERRARKDAGTSGTVATRAVSLGGCRRADAAIRRAEQSSPTCREHADGPVARASALADFGQSTTAESETTWGA